MNWTTKNNRYRNGIVKEWECPPYWIVKYDVGVNRIPYGLFFNDGGDCVVMIGKGYRTLQSAKFAAKKHKEATPCKNQSK